MPPPVVLTVAAHDPLGGAGVAADLTTFAALNVHGVVVVTAVTAQRLGSVDRVDATSIELVDAQLDGVISDLTPVAIKTGLLGSAAIVEAVARRIGDSALPAPVVDPILVDGRGRRLVDPTVEQAYRDDLFPVARVLTPNLDEASVLVGRPLTTVDEVVAAAPELAGLGATEVVVTGGRFGGREASDIVISADGGTAVLTAARVATDNVRGSGCTFAAAIAARLAAGDEPLDAIRAAKTFVVDRLADSASWSFGPGGPVSHRFDR